MHVEFTLNGARRSFDVAGDECLADTLRRDADASSVRVTCGLGLCGTCTVLLDGAPVSGCLMLTHQAADRSVITSEGLGDGASLSEVQAAFVDAGAYQCGYCIPGFVLTVHAHLQTNAAPTVAGIREELGGNLCRCGSYTTILDAVTRLVDVRTARSEQRG